MYQVGLAIWKGKRGGAVSLGTALEVGKVTGSISGDV